MALMDAAEARGANIYFDQRCTGLDFETGSLRLRDELTGGLRTVAADPVIATDGWGSAIRQEMMRTNRFNFSQEYLDYGYKELTIPAGPNGEHLLDKHALHIWPRGNYMLIALPNIDGTFACILFLPFAGDSSFAELDNEEKVIGFVLSRFPDVVPLMPDLAANYFANPTGSMVTIKCSPWHVDGRALLLGDSAHAIVPFFGQGLNCAFEDCTILLEILDRHGADWARVFTEFERSRKADADAIADLARDNFVEMRDKVADPRFLFKKKVELALQDRFPKAFVPKYSMVTFHRMPYALAQSRGAIQDRILAELCDPVSRMEELDWNRAAALIESDLGPHA
jgi:kynurenine 3-monooxygenase